MITNNYIKELKSLSTTKYRQKYNKFLVEGDKSCSLFLESPFYDVQEIIALPAWLENKTFPASTEVYETDERTIKKISNHKSPPDVIVVVNMVKHSLSSFQGELGRSIYLDEIQNPGNIGTIIRLADWFGFQNIIASENTADFYHPKVVQSSMGSMTGVNLLYGSTEELLKTGSHLVTADLNGTPLNSYTFPKDFILIMGNEGHGINPKLKEYIHDTITIHGRSERQAESLNVAIACGIICYHAFN